MLSVVLYNVDKVPCVLAAHNLRAMTFDLCAKTKTDARWGDSHPALNTLVRNFSPCSPQCYCFISSSSSSCVSPPVILLSHVKTTPSYLQFFSSHCLYPSLFLFHILSLEFSLIMFLFARNLFAFSLCVCIAGIGRDLFIVVWPLLLEVLKQLCCQEPKLWQGQLISVYF